jgi:sugar lactone lactonase YvrE
MGGAIQGTPLNLTNDVSTLAGAAGGQDGVGVLARFSLPTGVASDGTNLYVADGNIEVIRKVVIATGAVTTFAGKKDAPGGNDAIGAAARFSSPRAITSDGTYLYVTDTFSYTIRKIDIATASVTTLAGKQGFPGSDDLPSPGPGLAAKFNQPQGICTDGANLYVADTANHTIRKIVIATGAVTTLAGTAGVAPGTTDGTGSAARFNRPVGITTDGTNLFVGDSSNNSIRKIVISTGVVTTLAGSTAGLSGSTDATGTAARFSSPQGISTDNINLFVSDTFNQTVRKIVISTGVVTTFAGTKSAVGTTDGIGAVARFYSPRGLAVVGSAIYLADGQNYTIRKIDIATAEVSSLAGVNYGIDGTGAAANFTRPSGVTTDGTNLYVADTNNNTLRKIVIETGVVTTLAGMARAAAGSNDGTASAARFSAPAGITTNGTSLYVTDAGNHTVREMVLATGVVSTLAGTVGVTGNNDLVGLAATFNQPNGITTDGTNLYVADTLNHTIRKIVLATRQVSTLAGTVGVPGSDDLPSPGPGLAAKFNQPGGITTDGTNLYVADSGNHTIRKIVISTGAVSTIAGTALMFGSDDNTGALARFNYPTGISTDGKYLYVSDFFNNRVRKIELATGVVTTVAGSGVYGSSDGILYDANFRSPLGITNDAFNLYVVDSQNHTVRKIH